MSDEVAYEARVTALEVAWLERIDANAAHWVDDLRKERTIDDLQMEATDEVCRWLFCKDDWTSVKARDISDIAYEAVGRAIAKGY